MPSLKPVESLLDSSSTSVSQYLWKFVKSHVEDTDCRYCTAAVMIPKCSTLTSIQEKLSVVPDDAYKYVHFKIEKMFKTEWGEINYMSSDRYKRIKIQKLLFSLKIDSKCFIYDVQATIYEAFYFVKKFGTKIKGIFFTDTNKCYEDIPRNSESLLTLMFSMIRNVQVISLKCIEVSRTLLGCIGRECNQLKTLQRVNLLQEFITTDSFFPLFYRDNTEVKNKCCETLETVEIASYPYFKYDTDIKIYAITTTPFLYICNSLIQHLPNLKYLGEKFILEKYLSEYENTDTSLIEVHSNEMNLQTFLLFQLRFPKCKKLHIIMEQAEDIWSGLRQLPNLEELELKSFNQNLERHDVVLYDEIMVAAWPHLKHLDINISIGNLNISVFAEVCPVLESLRVKCDTAAWDERTYFRNLKKIHFQLEDLVSFYWMQSFSPTIKDLYVYFPNIRSIEPEISQLLVTIGFPNLRHLKITPLEFNRDFATGILAVCQQIQTLAYFTLRRWQPRQAFYDFRNEMKNQNYDISVLDCN